MRHQWKRLAALGCAVVLIAAACSRDDSSSSTTAKDGSSTTAKGGSNAAFINPSTDCANYKGTQGINGDTIKIGTIRPADGPYAIYDQVTSGLEAYVTSVNSQGGIKAGDGKSYKLELVKENDSYDPGKTPALAKKLVEQDQVFGLVGVIGTENNLAIRQYLNDACVPNVSLATGSPEWGNADQFPWYIAGLPSYATEASYWVDYLEKANPKAKIALLYQDDDFGKSYQSALKKDIEQANKEKGTSMSVVAEQSYNPLSGGTTEAATVQLSQSGADTFIVGLGGTPCPQTLKFVPDTWKPMTFVSVTCSVNTAMSLAGGKEAGVLAAQATLDPSDPADASNPKVQQFMQQGAAAGLSDGQLKGGITAVGWTFGALLAEGLEKAKTVDRAGVMNSLFSLKNGNFGLLRDEVTVETNGAKDPWPIEGFRIVQRNPGGGWTAKTEVTNKEGESNQLRG
jgi:branched-chain amino acid transport system substrate-binding protein